APRRRGVRRHLPAACAAPREGSGAPGAALGRHTHHPLVREAPAARGQRVSAAPRACTFALSLVMRHSVTVSTARRRVWSRDMLSILLVFAHLLAASTALGAIVATDLRLLSKLAQDRTRIAPPNEFVARIVVVALIVLYATGAAIVGLGVLERADYLANPKLQ